MSIHYIVKSSGGSTGVSPVLSVGTNVLPPGFYFPEAETLVEAIAVVGTAPMGSDLILAVKDGSNTVAIITVPAGQTIGSATISYSVAADSLLTVDVTQIGSTTPGSDLSVILVRSGGTVDHNHDASYATQDHTHTGLGSIAVVEEFPLGSGTWTGSIPARTDAELPVVHAYSTTSPIDDVNGHPDAANWMDNRDRWFLT